MKKIGVVLSGCGVRDGSEIHEAVFALLAIDQAGCEAVCMAPDVDFAVTDHLTMQETGEKRNIWWSRPASPAATSATSRM